MRIGKKTIHSVIIGLAMALPILYLGGSLIATLAGAHGNSGLSAEYEVVTDVKEVDFNQLVKGSSSSGFGGVNLTFDSDNGVYTVNGTPNSTAFFGLSSPAFDLKAEHTYIFRTLPYSSNMYTYVNNPFKTFANEYNLFKPTIDVQGVYFALTIVNGYIVDNVSFIPQVFDLTQIYGFGNEPDVAGFLADFGEDYYPYVLSNPTYITKKGVPDYSQYLFNQFFAKDNFVSQIGANALSDNPKGFSPFGMMLRYLDFNMFHAGDTQTGLMVYGMVYWSLHVIIADLVYHVLVFVPNLINKVFDWFGQRGLDDD